MNSEVVFPYINGDDLNSNPEQRPSRWVINFWDWPEKRAETYKEPYDWIKERVYPERLKKSKEKSYRKIMSMWWLFWRHRPELYHAIGRGHHFECHPRNWSPNASPSPAVLAITRVSKTLAFSFIDSNITFSDATVVFALGRGRDLALLQSNVHAVFAWQHASRLKSDLRYSPTDALEPFAFPPGFHDAPDEPLDGLGERLHQARIEVMRADRIGLTKLYNRFHTGTERDPRIERLRALQREIDIAVASSYGWDDLHLEHGFHEVPYLPENDRIRFTVSETARVEVLRRLSELNRQRYEEEVAQGLHGGKGAGSVTRKPRVSRLDTKLTPQPSFDFGDVSAIESEYPMVAESSARYYSDPARAIINHLTEHPGWHTKAHIIAATGIPERQWSTAIADLIAGGKVERQGAKRGTKYRTMNRGQSV